jgi:hypothetical protein
MLPLTTFSRAVQLELVWSWIFALRTSAQMFKMSHFLVGKIFLANLIFPYSRKQVILKLLHGFFYYSQQQIQNKIF